MEFHQTPRIFLPIIIVIIIIIVISIIIIIIIVISIIIITCGFIGGPVKQLDVVAMQETHARTALVTWGVVLQVAVALVPLHGGDDLITEHGDVPGGVHHGIARQHHQVTVRPLLWRTYRMV